MPNVIPLSLPNMLGSTPYTSYTYAYPHKTAYRTFESPLPLHEIWQEADRQAPFLYLHVPFCEMRCGFCNLFTTINPATDFVEDFLRMLKLEAGQVRAELGPVAIARMAIGGGTPTYLEPQQLERLFGIAEGLFGVTPGTVPLSVETSPLTATPERLQVLKDHGTDRISIGVQSFMEDEVRRSGRAQQTSTVHQALTTIRALDFAHLNIDLIYGLPGQTIANWEKSLRAALAYQPEEIYLYPLYVRPLTGLDRIQQRSGHDKDEDIRLACYQAARDLLLEAGYQQVSMRMFQSKRATVQNGPVYCVQDDGMIGLGCGARSYTRSHHYSNEYAVSARGVKAILAEYIATPAEAFASARFGFTLDADEQHRRYVLKSLLETGGLDRQSYQDRFNQDVFQHLPQITELLTLDLVVERSGLLLLTERGMAYSDTIGPWLYSAQVRQRMEGYTLR
ncbi:coproporphyrinogen III oxidase [Dictyobacter alpinus]|uniref:Heme chaperone HemW n=1 Tax=Dictyobacter alpinus TaxID=2014873 RepID=A0A402BCU9_9CHLR|nr:STM4012 family radical SAM protein [Dictyobacter alpinus]GCE29140.1 coproporphyrinogen III oxidase [Dictyobacter alpinus]